MHQPTSWLLALSVIIGTIPALAQPGPVVPLTAQPQNPTPETQQRIQRYIASLAQLGFDGAKQAVWLQTDQQLLANVQGSTPRPAASLTKVAVTLAALSALGPEHQFVSEFAATGPIQNGVLQGDLVVRGGQDPLFVWEEAVAVGNLLNQLGIRQVRGNLIVVGRFYMNFFPDPQRSGNLLRQGLDGSGWPAEAEAQFKTLPAGTPRPQIRILGTVRVQSAPPSGIRPLVRHYSLPLAELIKKMNLYSNNPMADMLADAVGGPKAVADRAAALTGLPPNEFQFKNGSGLGKENRISPRGACALFLTLDRYLRQRQLTLGDVFAVVSQDEEGVLENRLLPRGLVTKSGTLNVVSALAGALPTQKGILWFAIMNQGSDPLRFRAEQGRLLQSLLDAAGPATTLPPQLAPTPARRTKTSRSEIVR